MSKQVSQNQALFKLVRLFVVQYISTVHNYKSVQNQAINMLSTYIMRRKYLFIKVMKKLVLQTKRLLAMQGRTEPNCLHLLVSAKQLQLFDLDKLNTFIMDKRYYVNLIKVLRNQFRQLLNDSETKFTSFHMFSYKVIINQQLETISKVFENDFEMTNKYQKQKQLSTIRVIKPVYFFNFDDQNQILPFKCSIDQAFNKPAEFTYKNTIQKIQKQKKNVDNLVAFTRRQNRKALGLYLDSIKEDQKPKKKIKHNQQDQPNHKENHQAQNQITKQFNFITFL